MHAKRRLREMATWAIVVTMIGWVVCVIYGDYNHPIGAHAHSNGLIYFNCRSNHVNIWSKDEINEIFTEAAKPIVLPPRD